MLAVLALYASIRVSACPGAQSGLGRYHITGLSGGAHDINAIFKCGFYFSFVSGLRCLFPCVCARVCGRGRVQLFHCYSKIVYGCLVPPSSLSHLIYLSYLRWKGNWHVMNQRNNDWGHLISKDFIRWTRLPDALDVGSWDGSLSILNGDPVILYDCELLFMSTLYLLSSSRSSRTNTTTHKSL